MNINIVVAKSPASMAGLRMENRSEIRPKQTQPMKVPVLNKLKMSRASSLEKWIWLWRKVGYQ